MKTTPEQRARWRALVAELRRNKDDRRYLGGMLITALDAIDAAEKRIAELEAMADESTVLDVDRLPGSPPYARVDFDMLSVWVGPTGCEVYPALDGEDGAPINAPSIDDVIARLRRAKAIVEGK